MPDTYPARAPTRDRPGRTPRPPSPDTTDRRGSGGPVPPTCGPPGGGRGGGGGDRGACAAPPGRPPPDIAHSSDDLPDPLRPMSATTSPAETSRSTDRTATWSR